MSAFTAPVQKHVTLSRYYLMFAGIYAGALAGVGVLLSVLGFNSGTGANIGILLGAAVLTAGLFLKEQGRAPTASEKHHLSIGSTFAATIVSAIAAAGLYAILSTEEKAELSGVLNSVSLGMFAVIGIVYLALSYGVMRVAYGWVAEKMSQKIMIKGE